MDGAYISSSGSLNLALLRERDRDLDFLTDFGLDVRISKALKGRLVGFLLLN